MKPHGLDRVRGRTVHRALGLRPDDDLLEPIQGPYVSLLVVDETGMMTPVIPPLDGNLSLRLNKGFAFGMVTELGLRKMTENGIAAMGM